MSPLEAEVVETVRGWLQANPHAVGPLLEGLRVLGAWYEYAPDRWDRPVLAPRHVESPFSLWVTEGRAWDANKACPGDCEDPEAEGGRSWATLKEAQAAMDAEARAAGWALSDYVEDYSVHVEAGGRVRIDR